MYGIFMPFNYISTSFFIHGWYNDEITETNLHKAGEAMALPFLISAFIVPVLSHYIDKYGKRSHYITFAALLTLCTFILFLTIQPLYGLICFGVSFSIFASVVWPSVTVVIPNRLVGLALGLTTSLQNTSMSIFPIIIAHIYNASNNFNYCLLFFMVISIMANILAIFIYKENCKMDNILNRADIENARVNLEPTNNKKK